MGFTTSYQAMVKASMREIGSSTPVPSRMPRRDTQFGATGPGRPTRTLFAAVVVVVIVIVLLLLLLLLLHLYCYSLFFLIPFDRFVWSLLILFFLLDFIDHYSFFFIFLIDTGTVDHYSYYYSFFFISLDKYIRSLSLLLFFLFHCFDRYHRSLFIISSSYSIIFLFTFIRLIRSIIIVFFYFFLFSLDR